MVEIKKANCIDYNESITKAQSKIGKNKEAVIILKNDKYYGILDTRHIIEHQIKDPSTTKCGLIAQRAPIILEDEYNISEMTTAFYTVRFPNLAVIDKNEKVVGTISRFEVLNQILNEKDIPKKRVEQIMSSPILTINVNAHLNEATTKMRKEGVRRLIVIENEKLKGLLSAYDIGLNLIQPTERLPRLKHEKVNIWEQPISPFIKSKVETIGPDKTLTEAIKKMLKKEVPSLIVCENGKPIGLISTRDVFETVLRSKKNETLVHISGLDQYDKPFYQEIVTEGERALEKIKRDIEGESSISLHIKKTGNRYTVLARLEIANKVINTSGSEWTLPSAVNEALENLKRIVRKQGRKHYAE